MDIIIDTSVFRKDRGFLNSDILLLKKLSKLNMIRIHIPWVVYKESTTQNSLDIDASLCAAIKEISALDRKGLDKKECEELEKISVELEKIKSRAGDSVNEHWGNFIRESKAILYDIDVQDGRAVMNSYFLGLPPFPTPKSRKDIPDAFIYEAILSISKKTEKINFICDDNNLRNSIAKNINCDAYKSYEELYESDEFKAIETEYKKVEQYADELILLRENTDKIEQYAKYELYHDLLAGDEQVITNDNIPSDCGEGALQSISDDSVEEIMIDKIQFVDGVFYIPIKMRAVFGIEYFYFKADYYIHEEGRNISIIEHDWNDHYFLVEENFDAKIFFKVKIEQDCLRGGHFDFGYEPAIIEELNTIKK